MFEGLEHVGPIRIGLPVITVMKQNNVAGSGFGEPSLNAARGLRSPVTAGNRPIDHLGQAGFPGGGMEQGPAKPERRPNQRGAAIRRMVNGEVIDLDGGAHAGKW